MRLTGKTALITGGAHGMGESTARLFAREGARVAIADILESEGARVANEIGGDALFLRLDVSDEAQWRQAMEAVIARFGRLDILVNNAGVIEPIAEIASSDPAAWADSIRINLIGAYNAVRAVLPGMIEAGGGTIVNVSSGAAYRPLEGWSAYCSGKAGLAMMTRAIVLETPGRGIRAFGFSPGTIDTDMQVKIRASGMNMISQIPRQNLSPVADAVRGLLYLCDAAADDLIGQDASMRDEPFRKRIGL